MATSEELLAELLATSQEQLRWSRAAALPGIRATVADALPTTQQRRAFELCDGTRQSTGRAVGGISGLLSRRRRGASGIS